MNIIITGTSGTVGSRLIQLLEGRFDNIIGVQRNRKSSNKNHIYYFSCNDLSNQDTAKQTFQTIINQFDQIHVLVNVAGGFDMGNNAENVKDWDRMLNINFYTMLNATINVLPNMKKNQFR